MRYPDNSHSTRVCAVGTCINTVMKLRQAAESQSDSRQPASMQATEQCEPSQPDQINGSNKYIYPNNTSSNILSNIHDYAFYLKPTSNCLLCVCALPICDCEWIFRLKRASHNHTYFQISDPYLTSVSIYFSYHNCIGKRIVE